MMVIRAVRSVLCGLWLAGGAALQVDAAEEGFLCCNLYMEDGWISDMNLHGEAGTVLPAGTPVTVLGLGRQRVKLRVQGKEVGLGNDYSRKLDLQSFQQRYVVAENPADRKKSFAPEVQILVGLRRVAPGMNREQVVMSLGYPVASATPDLNAKTWTYYFRSDQDLFWVLFDDAGLVQTVRGEEASLAVVAPAMLTPERLAQATAGEPACALNVYHAAGKWGAVRGQVIVYVDDQKQGSLSMGESLCLDLPAGPHTVSIRETHMLLPMPFKGREQSFVVGQGPVFFRYQKLMSGMAMGGAGAVPTYESEFGPATQAQWQKRD